MAFERCFNAIRFLLFLTEKIFSKVVYISQNHYLYSK